MTQEKIHDWISLNKLNELFGVMLYICYLSFDDGVCYFVNEKYMALADLFEKYLKENKIGKFERYEEENFVYFSEGMNKIGFHKTDEKITFSDFTVKILRGLI
jgi:hypothetical protein